jgi:Mor family transcriptional regulator
MSKQSVTPFELADILNSLIVSRGIDFDVVTGEDIVKALNKEFGGRRYNFPQASSLSEFRDLETRNRYIRRMLERGVLGAELADDLNLSPKRIRDIARGY